MKLFDLTGRVAIVAGRNGEKNRAAVKELEGLGANAASFEADITSPAACQALIGEAVTRFGRLDILVNNAGMNIRKQPEEYALEEWNQVLTTNLTSAFVCSQ